MRLVLSIPGLHAVTAILAQFSLAMLPLAFRLLLTMALALQGYGDGSVKVTIPNASGKAGHRQRMYLPKCGWLTERLQRHGLRPLLADTAGTIARRRQADAGMETLILVKPGAVVEGQLSIMHEEARLLWEFWRRPKFAFTLEVVHTVLFDSMLPPSCTAVVRQSRSKRVAWQHASVAKHWLFRPAVSLDLPIQGLDALLDRHSAQHLPPKAHLCQDDIHVLWLPEPILQLLVRGAWSHLCVPLSIPGVASFAATMQWPEQRWLQQHLPLGAVQVPITKTPGNLHGRALRDAADSLRTWASAIQEHSLQNSESADSGRRLEEIVGLLDNLACDFGDGYQLRADDEERPMHAGP